MANYTLNTDERSLSLYCRSEDASFLGDATYRWEFPNTIGQTKERNKRLVIGVKSICFTNGIYNINATTNTVNWDGTNYTIPEELYGNYTSANIIQLLGGQPIVGLFNPTTGVTNPSWTGNPPNVLTVFSTTKSKFFIKKNAANTTFNITPFWALLGFTKDVFALTTYAEADEVSDLKSFTSLIVKTNLGVTAYTTKMGMENVIARIPISQDFGDSVTHNEENPFLNLIDEKGFQTLELTFYNEFSNQIIEPQPIDIGTFSLTLILYTIYEPLMVMNKNSIHAQPEDKEETKPK
tara:strand:+ start:309 stop:1190 length:882 start_codon:yes stop_codon:yes gene_type:complete